MKYLFLLFLLIGCSLHHSHEIPVKTVDVRTLPECPNEVLKTRRLKEDERYVRFKGDNGNFLYVATDRDYQCLKRIKK